MATNQKKRVKQGETKEVRVTVNFEFLIDNFHKYRGLVLPGGTRSAKTISVCQFIIHYCRSNTGKHIIIARDTLATLKKTTLPDFEAVCHGKKGCDAMAPEVKIMDRRGDPHCTINGNTIAFIGLNDDPMRVHGMDSDFFYINEAVGTYHSTFKQLNQRSNDGYILDCNPSEPNSWVYLLDKQKRVKLFRTTFLDNPFLKQELIDQTLAYEPTHPEDRHLQVSERRPHPTNIEECTADAKQWSIYGLGLVYKGKEIIFPEWDTFKDDPEECEIFYGIDWGWNHPFAFIKVMISGNDLYLREVMYGSEIEVPDYTDCILSEKYLMDGETYVVCDTNEPKSIKALQRLEVPATKAKKPPGSINDGIKIIKKHRIHIHEDSQGLQFEANNYKWKVDEKNDIVLDIAVDKDNHGFDATRYPLFMFAS